MTNEERLDATIDAVQKLSQVVGNLLGRIEKLEARVADLQRYTKGIERYAKGIDVRVATHEDKHKDDAADTLRLLALEARISRLEDETERGDEYLDESDGSHWESYP